MAAKRRSGSSAYVYGSVAYERNPEREAAPKKQHSEVRVQKPRSHAAPDLHMSLTYVLAMSLLLGAALYVCVQYLSIQSRVTARLHNIEVLEKQLEQLKSENDALQTHIYTNIDLDHIFQVATEEMGMVYANKDQVLLYDRTESEYVRQYEDIPN